jgi:peptidyl-prolyl cis-trans isomerase SurA
MKKYLLAAFCTLTLTAAFAQPKKVLADKIIATLGDKIILKSEIDNSIADMVRQNIEVPANGNCLILQQAMMMKALVVQAEKDSLVVTDEEVEAEIDNKIRYYISYYGSKEELEQIAGKSIFQLKEDFRQSFREQKLAQSMRNKIVDNVKITPTEVRAYFEQIPPDSLPFYESELEVGQVVIYPKASRDLEMYAIEQLKEYKQQVETGGKKFETLASLYTDDPGSKETGGKYDINRNEKQWDPLFLAKAFSLKEGQISNPFKTRFGYHIIQMISRAGDDASIRHILKIPQITTVELKAAKAKLDSIRSKLIAGTMEFGEAVNKYSDDETSKFTGGRIVNKEGTTFLSIDELDKDLVVMLKDLKVDEYSQPTEFTDERGRKGVRIVQLITRTQPHRENLKDDYNKIAARALEEKKNSVLDKWFQDNFNSYYVKIDGEYSGCKEVGKWK